MISILDVYSPYFIFSITLVLLLILLLKQRVKISEWIKPLLPSKVSTLALLLSLFASTYVLFSWIPHQPRVQSDESLLLSTAQNMAYNSMSGSCEEGLFLESQLHCVQEYHLFKGKLWSFLFSFLIPYFSSISIGVIVLQTILWLLCWISIFFASKAWSDSNPAALLTTILILCNPIVLQIFASGTSDSLHLWLAAMVFLFLHYVRKKPSILSVLTLFLLFSLWCQTRLENIFSLPGILILTFSFTRERFKPFILISLAAMALVAATPSLATLLYFQDFNLQAGMLNAHGHLLENFATFFSASNYLPYPFFQMIAVVALSILFLISTQKPKEKWPQILAVLLLFLPSIVVLQSVSADFSLTPNMRYLLTWFPLLAFFASWFAFRKVTNNAIHHFASLLGIIAIMILQFLDSEFQLKNDLPYANDPYLHEQNDIRNAILSGKLSTEGLFIYTSPSHFVGDGFSGLFVGSIARPDGDNFRAIVKSYKFPKYLVWGIECNQNVRTLDKISRPNYAPICEESKKYLDIDSVPIQLGKTLIYRIR